MRVFVFLGFLIAAACGTTDPTPIHSDDPTLPEGWRCCEGEPGCEWMACAEGYAATTNDWNYCCKPIDCGE